MQRIRDDVTFGTVSRRSSVDAACARIDLKYNMSRRYMQNGGFICRSTGSHKTKYAGA